MRVSVIVVAYQSRAALSQTIPALLPELADRDELVVVDNASTDGTVQLVRELAPRAAVVETGRNAGFAAGANAGAHAASGDLLVFLNPDAVPHPGFGAAIRAPLLERRGWAAWMGLVTAERGRLVNTNGGVLHFTGIAWAGEAGRTAPGTLGGPREVAFVSGACLAIPRERWLAAGGFAERFFMYHEDVDLSLRLRLAGGRLGIEPTAVVDHDYAFVKGAEKWRLLERNRWATIVRCYPAPLLAALTPALVVTEIALLGIAAAAGWLPQKLRATMETLLALPRLLAERRAVQAKRVVPAADIAAWLTAELDSPFLGRAARVRGLSPALRAYRRLVLAVLGTRR